MNNNEQTTKKRALRARYGLRMRYEEASALLEDMSLDLNDSQLAKVMRLVFGVRKYLASEEHFVATVEEVKETFDCEVCDETCAKNCVSSCAESCVNLRKENSANTQTTNAEETPHACVGTGTGNNGDISLPEISPKDKELEDALSVCVSRLWTAEGPDGQLHCVRKQLMELLSLSVEDNAISKICFGFFMRRTLVAHFARQRQREKSPRDFATASRKLRRWIHDDPPLNEHLRRMGYHASQKYFSEAHFEVLKEYIGEPLE